MLNNRRHSKQNIFHTAGWLFADLLLALTIIFIAASTTSKPQVKAAPSPTPVPTLMQHPRRRTFASARFSST